MRAFLIAGLLGAAAGAQTPAPAPDPFLAGARSWALQYSEKLPDFLCTEFIRRFANWQGPEIQLDTLTLQLGFADHKQTFKLVARDGHPTAQNVQSLNGSFTNGEFGSALFLAFDPESGAAFQPQPKQRIRRRPMAVYAYAIPQAHSHYRLQYGTTAVMTAYHGLVYIDLETDRVARLTMAVDPPADFGIQESSTTLDYDWRDVGGAQYLLPVHADVRTTERPHEVKDGAIGRRPASPMPTPMRYHNVVDFRDYHKFATESKLGFDR